MQNTVSIVHLLTWHGKRAEITNCKSTKRAHPRRVAERGIFVKMWECIRMQEMVWWREGLLGETNLHMEIRVSVDKILLKLLHYFVLIWAGLLHRDWVGQKAWTIKKVKVWNRLSSGSVHRSNVISNKSLCVKYVLMTIFRIIRRVFFPKAYIW